MDSLFFILSKLAWVLISPTNLIVFLMALVAVMLLMNKINIAKWILLPTVMACLILLAYPVSDYLIRPLESRFDQPVELPEEVDGILILGGGEDLKRFLSWNDPAVGLAGDRFISAAILARHYPDVPVIFTGGSGLVRVNSGVDSQKLAIQLLTAVGIAPERFIIESESRNTYENFKNVKPFLPMADGHYLLVTSAFHMPRSVGVARQQNINVIPYPVDYRSYNNEFRQWDFDLFEHLQVLEPAWKEWVGLTVYYFNGKTSAWLPEQNG